MVNRMNKGRPLSMGCNSMGENHRGSGRPMGNPPSGKQKGKAILEELQTIDFALVETVLYLDAYPNCAKALAYYNKLMQKREALCNTLKEAGIPINAMSNTAGTWTWANGPWPWQLEANL